MGRAGGRWAGRPHALPTPRPPLSSQPPPLPAPPLLPLPHPTSHPPTHIHPRPPLAPSPQNNHPPITHTPTRVDGAGAGPATQRVHAHGRGALRHLACRRRPLGHHRRQRQQCVRPPGRGHRAAGHGTGQPAVCAAHAFRPPAAPHRAAPRRAREGGLRGAAGRPFAWACWTLDPRPSALPLPFLSCSIEPGTPPTLRAWSTRRRSPPRSRSGWERTPRVRWRGAVRADLGSARSALCIYILCILKDVPCFHPSLPPQNTRSHPYTPPHPHHTHCRAGD